jgi:hypothetical protein
VLVRCARLGARLRCRPHRPRADSRRSPEVRFEPEVLDIVELAVERHRVFGEQPPDEFDAFQEARRVLLDGDADRLVLGVDVAGPQPERDAPAGGVL